MQRNEVDAFLSSSEIGLGTPETWQRVSLELEGRTVLEKPHVSKKVLLKAVRMQADAMRYMVDEFERIRDKMNDIERENKASQKHVERLNTKLVTLHGQFEEMTTKVHEVELVQAKQEEQLKRIDEVAGQVRANREEMRVFQQRMETLSEKYEGFVAKMEMDLRSMQQDQEATRQFALKLEDRMNTEEKELYLASDHILHGKLSLAMWMEMMEKDNRKQDDAIREASEKMIKQGRNVQEMMLETRRTLDDNTCAVEDVQRLLLEKADKARVDEVIESKYEEICNQLDRALASVIGEEDEFKRVCQELQQLVTHLSESKADKKELLEIKEQVLYDSRVRQQVENLRSFIDLKMNREDVFSALKNKADKDEMLQMLKGLSESMTVSMQHAQKVLTEPESAFLTSKNAIAHTCAPGHHHGGKEPKRQGMLPSLDKEKCLSCNSTIRDSGHDGRLINKNAYQMTPVYGGGFQLASSASSPVVGGADRHHKHRDRDRDRDGAERQLSFSGRHASLSDTMSEGFLLGIDGHVYQADPEILASTINERVQMNERTNRASPMLKLPGSQKRGLAGPEVPDNNVG